MFKRKVVKFLTYKSDLNEYALLKSVRMPSS